jgi:cytochrome c peroxidase
MYRTSRRRKRGGRPNVKSLWLACMAVLMLVAAAMDSPPDRDRIPTAAREEIKAVELEIDRIEDETLNRAQSSTLDRFQQITRLGKLIFHDRELSVNRNESCSFCHMPETGFTGPVSALNQTTSAYPGSVRTRFSGRS